ncbi:MAG: DUF924 domain-containing protein [Chromatiales bacterium]|jgi:uncharacterized protein (DUF924 family)|nr:DUF924 domain-containing protein [Chromatiales bacterium]
MSEPSAEEIVDFWLGDAPSSPEAAEARRKVWYDGGAQLDAQIVHQFGASVEAACEGEWAAWESEPIGALALIVLLDQFTRNIFRGTPRAYAGDERAWRVANAAVDAGLHHALSIPGQLFLFHPFHHHESLAGQDRSVALLEAIVAPPQWEAYVSARVQGFSRHRDIVARFGRFPHRNHTLGRADTPEEAAHLAGPHESFGQAQNAAPLSREQHKA